MDTIKQSKPNCRVGEVSRYSLIFFTFLLSLVLVAKLYAQPYEHEIQVDFSFDPQAVSGKDVVGYRLYKLDETVCEVQTPETQSITCTIFEESGTYDFYLSALYSDDSESPKSAPFTFVVPDIVSDPIAPVISISNVVNNLPEDLNTGVVTKVADIVVTDADGGNNSLSLSGADAGLFTIGGVELFLKSGTSLDYEIDTSLDVIIEVDDPLIPTTPDDSFVLNINIVNVNEPPTVSLHNVASALTEDTATGTPIKVADIAVVDDDLGTNNLVLSGPDADMFTISGTQIFLRSGVSLDFEANQDLDVVVEVDDPALSPHPQDSSAMTIAVININEAPSLSLANTITTLPENFDTSSAVKVADIVITDDALGTNILSVSGPDADMFHLAGTELVLNAGVALNFETNAVLDVTVVVDDPDLLATAEDSVAMAVNVTDVNETPSVSLAIITSTLAEDADTATALKVADITIHDDNSGTNNLSLSGPDSSLFIIDGMELVLKAGTVLDFETNAVLDVVVDVDDSAIPGQPEHSAELSIVVTDVNEVALTAKIIAPNTEGEAPFTFTLDGSTSTGEITSYEWSFGDGGSAENTESAMVTHTYQDPGTYTVTLAVSDVAGGRHEDTSTIIATEPEPPDSEPTPPTAEISSSNAAGEAPLSVEFDGSGSEIDPQLTATYSWNFGEGSPATGATAAHTFTTPGTHHVFLTVVDSHGETDEAMLPVIVTTPEPENQAPIPVFTVDPSPEVPMTFFFDATLSRDPDGSVAEYLWDFGDGLTAEGVSPVHTYIEVGEYSVILQVTDDRGEIVSVSQTIDVRDETDSLDFEIAEIQVGSDWAQFTFNKPFIDPVIIASPVSFEDAEPATVRIRNVTGDGFEVRVQEWDYLDDTHGLETLSIIVMEKGVYTLETGAKIEVGSFETKSTRFKVRSLQQSYGSAPVILTQVMTEAEDDAVTVRHRRIGHDSFEYKLQEQEGNRKVHATETIGYIAWQPGSGEISGLKYEVGTTPQVVTHNWYDLGYQQTMEDLPFFFANMQTTSGGNSSVVRSRNTGMAMTQLNIEEEQSKDDEVKHTAKEVVGYVVMSPATPVAE